MSFTNLNDRHDLDTSENQKSINIPLFWKEWLKEFYLTVKDNIVWKNISFNQNITGSRHGKSAVIIEPRCHELLKYVIYNVMWFLIQTPIRDDSRDVLGSSDTGYQTRSGWSLTIFCGQKNVQYVKEELSDLLNSTPKGFINIVMMSVDNLTEEMYNNLLTNKMFYEFKR